MVEGEAAAFVYLNYCEGWAVDRLFYAKAFGYALGKDGFSGAQVTVQGVNLTGGGFLGDGIA